jgi:subtilisin-like proprotein convertase family protein
MSARSQTNFRSRKRPHPVLHRASISAHTAFEPLETRRLASVSTFTNSTPRNISDLSTIESSYAVSRVAGAITDLDVRVNINHTWCADLDVFLVSPTGTRVELFSDVGGSGNNFRNTTLDDEASRRITSASAPFTGRFRPERSLTAFDGQSANGTWRLIVRDDSGSDVGRLNHWTMTITHTDDGAGNTRGTARNVGRLDGTRLFRDFVGSSDRNDYYRFELATTSELDLFLHGLAADADLQLLDASGAVIATSSAGGASNDRITRGLSGGTYFARVYEYSGDTDYRLSMSAEEVASDDNSMGTANDVGLLTGSRSFSDLVGSSDREDFYRFELDSRSTLDVLLSGMSADADLHLLDANGGLIASSSWGGSANDSIIQFLDAGTYYVRVFQWSGDTSYRLDLSASADDPIRFSSFAVRDASGDSTPSSVFQGGGLRVSCATDDPSAVSSVSLLAELNGLTQTLGTWSGGAVSNALVNLSALPSLAGGAWALRAVAQTSTGQSISSANLAVSVLETTYQHGTFAPDRFRLSGPTGGATYVFGRGGTDTLDLVTLRRAEVTGINGASIGAFDPIRSSDRQAIFRGTAFDFLTLADGREIYLQGVEHVRFNDGELSLSVRPSDPHYSTQWNLHVTDVPGAWRFTRGGNGVLLASLDTGVLTAAGATGGIYDLNTAPDRLIVDPTDDDNFMDSGHGHCAISVMAGQGDNGYGVAGINWNSPVHVGDVYNGMQLQQAIADAIGYARSHGMRVVFQGGIQGDYWLNSGGTEQQLRNLIAANADVALFAIAAGNGGPGGNLHDPNYLDSVSGVARLESDFQSVMSVGALVNTGPMQSTVGGFYNAGSVDIAGYSNRGPNLTLMAPTDSPAMNKYGFESTFGGTSCANPNLAGIASLVWSANPALSAAQVRAILTETAMDLGAAGRDNALGNGLANADAAVRRAWALARDAELAGLFSGAPMSPGSGSNERAPGIARTDAPGWLARRPGVDGVDFEDQSISEALGAETGFDDMLT